MRRNLLDSNAVNALVNGQPSHVDRAAAAGRQGHRVGTCEPVVAELRYGLELSASRDANIVRLERGLRLLRCWPFDRAAAIEYGRIAADLRRRGRPMQTIDVMIAAVATSLGRCVVVTTDSDFLAIPGLAVEDWTTPLPPP